MTEERAEYAVTERDAVLYPSWERMKEQAAILYKSGFFPKTFKSSEQAIAVMLAGREMGLGPMESLRSIYIVDGQTCMSSGLMAGKIWDAGHGYEIVTSTDKECTIKLWRNVQVGMLKWERQFYTHTYTIEDAKKAGLTNKSNWQKYPKAMLFNRCISAGARAFMPDVIHNLYTPEEMGAAVVVTEAGDVVIDSPEVKDVTPGAGPEQIEGPQPNAWIMHDATRKKFWAETHELGLTHNEVHAACAVDSMKGYKDTFDAAIQACKTYIDVHFEA